MPPETPRHACPPKKQGGNHLHRALDPIRARKTRPHLLGTAIAFTSINDRRITTMTDVDTLIRRIDAELAVDVKREKAAWEQVTRANRERGPRLRHYEAVAQHVIELLKPRLDAFLDRFKAVVKAEPSVRQHTR